MKKEKCSCWSAAFSIVLGVEKVSVDDIGAASARILGAAIVIDGVGGDFEAGRLPTFGCFG